MANRDPQFCARKPYDGYLRINWLGRASWGGVYGEATWFGNVDNLRSLINDRFPGIEYTIVQRVEVVTEIETARLVVKRESV